MTRTWDAAAPAHAVSAEACPECASLDVRAIEHGWFVLDLEREDELRESGPAVEFACRECAARWN
ncbi:hypothetical protein AB1K54_03645 [Microbacterium sp. BWT-B31]|uniref:hypothetical protein n=1 Tax=Microbacterium sp. BWT-B31 TaxID=3232072 RepID=UPI0035299E4C